MPKSYMIKRFKKKGKPHTETKIKTNSSIKEIETDTTKTDISSPLNLSSQNGSLLHFKIDEKFAKKDPTSVPKLQEESPVEYRVPNPNLVIENEFGLSQMWPTPIYQHQTVPFGSVFSKEDHRYIPPQFIDMFSHAHTAPLGFETTNDSLMHCGIPDNISPKSATSAKERSPTFPTEASVPNSWSPHSILPPIKEPIFTFDPKLPTKSTIYHPYECSKRESMVRSNFIPKQNHISVWQLDKHITRHNNSANFSTILRGCEPERHYFHGDMNEDKGPKRQFPEDSELTFSPEKSLFQINHASINTYRNSNSDLGLNANHKPKSLPSKRIEFVNDGFGVTNPDLLPLVINDDRVKVKQPHQICVCQLCSLIFPKPKLLSKHIKEYHNKVKRYLCTFCNKGFNDKFDLKRHTRTHTGIRPFKCNICDKGFTQRCSLESHCKKVHSQEVEFDHKQRRDKMHICEECGSTTKDPKMHYNHIKRNHPDSILISKFHDKRQFKSTNARTDVDETISTNSHVELENA